MSGVSSYGNRSMVSAKQLAKVPFFQTLPAWALRRFAEEANEREVDRNELILHQQDEARFVFFLLSGSVQILMRFEGFDDRILWSAEFDIEGIEAPVAAMYAKLCAKYADCPRFTQFQGHNHVSHVMSINSADDAVGRAVLEFVHSVTAR